MTYNQLVRPAYWKTFLLIALVVLSADVTALLNSRPQDENLVGWAVAFDFALTLPLVYYFCIVRKRKPRPLLAVLPVFALGVFVGSHVLPESQQQVLDVLVYLAPAIELGLLLFALFKLRKVIRAYREAKRTELHWLDAIRQSFVPAFGDTRLNDIWAMEFGVWYYSLIAWWKKQPARALPASVTPFSMHRTSDAKTLSIVFAILILFEASLSHLIIAIWSDLWAWIATASSLYLSVALLGYWNSVKDSPILLTPERLYVRMGFLSRLSVERGHIASIRRVKSGFSEEKRDKNAFYALLFFDEAQFEIELKQPAAVTELFGRKRFVSKLYLRVDEPQAFEAALENRQL